MDISDQIDTFNRFARVSRETITSLKKYEKLLLDANKNTNLIGNSTINNIWNRHFLDSFQVIDFIDENDNSIVDLGSGAGFPGIIVALAARERKLPLKISLVEKSPKKVKFLKEIITELNLKIQIINKNVIDESIAFNDDVFVARAFKPIEIIFELIHKNAKNWKKVLIFLGKTGEPHLLQASKTWDIKYKQRVSITNKDSLLIEIKGLKKK